MPASCLALYPLPAPRSPSCDATCSVNPAAAAAAARHTCFLLELVSCLALLLLPDLFPPAFNVRFDESTVVCSSQQHTAAGTQTQHTTAYFYSILFYSIPHYVDCYLFSVVLSLTLSARLRSLVLPTSLLFAAVALVRHSASVILHRRIQTHASLSHVVCYSDIHAHMYTHNRSVHVDRQKK